MPLQQSSLERTHTHAHTHTVSIPGESLVGFASVSYYFLNTVSAFLVLLPSVSSLSCGFLFLTSSFPPHSPATFTIASPLFLPAFQLFLLPPLFLYSPILPPLPAFCLYCMSPIPCFPPLSSVLAVLSLLSMDMTAETSRELQHKLLTKGLSVVIFHTLFSECYSDRQVERATNEKTFETIMVQMREIDKSARVPLSQLFVALDSPICCLLFQTTGCDIIT